MPVGVTVARAAPAVAGRDADAARVLRLCAGGRAAGGRIAGGRAAHRSRAPDGGNARYRPAVRDAARTYPPTGDDRLSSRRTRRRGTAAAEIRQPSGRLTPGA